MTGRRPRIRSIGPMTAAALVLGLAGCTPAHAPALPSSSPSPPPSFPAVQGRTLSTSDDDGVEWHRVVRVTDSGRAYREARRLLVAAGFTLTKDRAGTGGGDGQACTAELCVGFTATDGTAAGPNVAYDVFRPTGIVD